MDCVAVDRLSNEEYLDLFRQKAVRQRVPMAGSIELTHRCNLRCVHCYLGPQSVHHGMQDKEMDSARILSLIDDISEAGCLFLLLTGGEPFLRKDFPVIYGYAKKKGMLVTVFTNGLLLTDEVISLFGDLPPQAVEITLYGATPETYEKITGIRGSFERCREGIDRLAENRINFNLKTILMTLNRHEFLEMKRIAKDYGAKFRFDSAISACLNGDRSPILLRVPAKEAVEKEFEDGERVKLWKDYLSKYSGEPLAEVLYNCGAGVTSFHVDPYGKLMPCFMTSELKYDLMTGSFQEGWRDVMPHIRDRRVAPDYICNRCDKRDVCGFCPPFFEMETDTGEIYSEYHCALAGYRHRAIYGGEE